MHQGARRRLVDVLTCVRTGVRIDALGRAALANAERRLRSEAEMLRLFAGHEDAVRRAGEIAASCAFSLDELVYEYPREIWDGEDPQGRLARLTAEGLAWRYPAGPPGSVRAQADHELALIGRLNYAPYFLTVNDMVAFARAKGILCQGRGSAANSVVCFALGVTSVSPEIGTMVFERFVSEARDEPPDIDVDFEHERREEVIQYIYARYGRERAGLCATVIHYRAKRAIREVGAAMGLSRDTAAALASQVWGWGEASLPVARLAELGLDASDPRLALTLAMVDEIIGFPRHLSQHVGGFVITEGRLDELAPVENAAMEDRTVIPWDKDDIDALGILKVDVLALGMLDLHPQGLRPDRRPSGNALHARDAAARGSGGLRHAVQGRFARRLPGGEPGADELPAADAAADLLRPRHRGGDRAPRADPGRHGASLPAPAPRRGARRVPLGRARRGAWQDAGGAAIPGAGDADRHHRRGLCPRRGRPAAPRARHVQEDRNDPHLPRALPRGDGGERPSAGFRGALLQPDRGLRRIRLPRSRCDRAALLRRCAGCRRWRRRGAGRRRHRHGHDLHQQRRLPGRHRPRVRCQRAPTSAPTPPPSAPTSPASARPRRAATSSCPTPSACTACCSSPCPRSCWPGRPSP